MASDAANRRVLVIDDNESIHQDFRKILSPNRSDGALRDLENELFGEPTTREFHLEFELDHALQGQEGFEKACSAIRENRPFAMAFVDMRMPPGWDGLETINQLWKVDPRLNVVICTAFSDYNWEDVTTQLGPNDRWLVLKKPFDPAEVNQLAAALVEKRRLSDELLSRMQMLETEVADCSLSLTERERRLDAILSTAPDGIIVARHDGTIESLNAAALELLRTTHAQAIGKSVLSFIESEKSSDQALQHAIHSLEISSKEWTASLDLTCRRSDRTVFPSHWTLRSFELNNQVYITAIVRDETEREKLRSDLVQAQKLEAIGQLAAGIAHEINTPTQFVFDNVRFLRESSQAFITAVNSFKQLLGRLEQQAILTDQVQEYNAVLKNADLDYFLKEVPTSIDQTLAGLERVSTIVRAMKDFSHPGTQQKEAADINAAIKSAIIVAQNEWKYVAELDLALDESVETFPCLIGELNQVMINLIINASHAIAERIKESPGSKGRIRISSARSTDGLDITVADTGSGIPEAIKHRVFDPFFTTKGVGKGTGQGLAIARSVIVDKHRGQITFDSNERGTTFRIYLPAKL